MVSERRLRFPARLGMKAAVCGVLLVSFDPCAFALSRNSTMSEWSEASAADQKRFLESVGPALTSSFQAREDEILTCLNSAAQSSAHAGLPVMEIAKACAAPPEPDNADQSKDI